MSPKRSIPAFSVYVFVNVEFVLVCVKGRKLYDDV